MSRTLKIVLAGFLILASFVGCTKSSDNGGRAGNDTFSINVPSLAVSIKQGEAQIARVVVERGKGFSQPVKLEFKTTSDIQVDLSSSVIKPGDKGDVQLTITASKDASLGEHKILVKGTPDRGDPAEVEFKVTVASK